MAIFDQSGQSVGVQVNADDVVTHDLYTIQRRLDVMITGLSKGTMTTRQRTIRLKLFDVYLEVTKAIKAIDASE